MLCNGRMVASCDVAQLLGAVSAKKLDFDRKDFAKIVEQITAPMIHPHLVVCL
jgi:hypothetical protein